MALSPAAQVSGNGNDQGRDIQVLMRPAGSSNPYLRLVIAGLGPGYRVADFRTLTLRPSADILHVHWPENLFRAGTLRRLARTFVTWWSLDRTIARVRRNGGALVWTAHNTERHESVDPIFSWFYAPQMRKFLRRVDLAIAMSADQLPLLLDKYPDIAPDRWRVAEHPHYRDAFADVRPREETRDRLGIPQSATLVVMLGFVRRYKGIEEAISVFRATARPNEILLVAGRCSDLEFRAQLERAAEGAPNVRLMFSLLSDTDIASLFKAADLALFNFTRILNSGSVIAALSLDCPVMAPHAAVFEEQARRNPEWLDLFERPLTPQRLRDRLDQVPSRRPSGSPNLDAQSVEAVGAAHRRIYAEALELARSRTG